ncbi:deoxyribonuclease V [Ketobacter sp. MCCC 1A13808]|nr:deoxyribonuclease V [Ketobacter sp. MCCC 1A13808]RLP55818.1 MAG: deoxyribonuclease V [Ketobacter sp.]
MNTHAWDLSPQDAIALQKQWADRVVLCDEFDEVRFVAGVDVGFEENNKVTRAAIAVLSFPSLQLVESALVKQPTRYPYIPGLLSFREMPAILAAYSTLRTIPDLLLCDGQGVAHPRRLGIASHLGVWLDKPAIGVGKSRLVGQYGPVPDVRGSWVALVDKGEEVGAVLRSRQNVKPIFISPGHKISIDSAIKWTMACTTRFKLPETTRHAHHIASNLK